VAFGGAVIAVRTVETIARIDAKTAAASADRGGRTRFFAANSGASVVPGRLERPLTTPDRASASQPPRR
jgi:hypothetical protein